MFIEIAEAHPRFLRRQLPEVVGAMLQVRRRGVRPGGWLCVPRAGRRGLSRRLSLLGGSAGCLTPASADTWQIAETEALEEGVHRHAHAFRL